MERDNFYRELTRKLIGTGIVGGGPPADVMHREGCVIYRLLGPNGELKQEGQFRNLVNSVGDRWVAHYLAGSIVGDARSMWAELGVNTTAPVKGGTALGTLIATSSLAVSAAYPTRADSFGTGPGEWTVWRFSWGAGVTTNGSIGEVGLRTQTGSFVAHAQVAPNVNKTSNDTLQIDWGWKSLGA
jgi:hypothetical protein